jgi:serine/threonine protein phosphatase PrpC
MSASGKVNIAQLRLINQGNTQPAP